MNEDHAKHDDWLVGAFYVERTGIPYVLESMMDSISVNRFRDNLKTFVEQVVQNHTPIKVTRRSGGDFIVISVNDWDREQETLYVLQNDDLMQQIAVSLESHTQRKRYPPSKDQIDEIIGL